MSVSSTYLTAPLTDYSDDLESGYCTKPIMNRTVAGNLTMRGYYRPSFCTELIDKVAQGVAQV